jgi:hypothetical protein
MKKRLAIIIPVFILVLSVALGSIILINSIKNGNRMSESEHNKKIDNYNKQIAEVNTKKIEEFKAHGITNEYNELQQEYSKLSRLKSDLTFKYNRDNNGSYDLFKLFPGFFIIIFGLSLSIIVFKFINFSFNPIKMSDINININSLNDSEEKEYVTLKCPNCGNTNLKGNDQEKCSYCGSLLQKVKKKK